MRIYSGNGCPKPQSGWWPTLSQTRHPHLGKYWPTCNLAGAQIITIESPWTLSSLNIWQYDKRCHVQGEGGAMQLYSRDRGVSQPIEGHAAAFAEISQERPSEADQIVYILCCALRVCQGMYKLHITLCITNTRSSSYMLWKSTIPLPTLLSLRKLSMSISHLRPRMTSSCHAGFQEAWIVYLVTKYSFIHLYDLEIRCLHYMNHIFGRLFLWLQSMKRRTYVSVNKKGQVLGVNVDEQTIIPTFWVSTWSLRLSWRVMGTYWCGRVVHQAISAIIPEPPIWWSSKDRCELTKGMRFDFYVGLIIFHLH